jgi:hypothetical protein
MSAKTLLLQLVASKNPRTPTTPAHPADVVPIRVDDETWINTDTLMQGYDRLAKGERPAAGEGKVCL